MCSMLRTVRVPTLRISIVIIGLTESVVIATAPASAPGSVPVVRKVVLGKIRRTVRIEHWLDGLNERETESPSSSRGLRVGRCDRKMQILSGVPRNCAPTANTDSS